MAKLMLVFDHDEVSRNIPYMVVCEAREGSRWNTGTRRRRWLQEFSEQERTKATTLFRQAHTWALVKGVPNTVRMTLETHSLWQKLGDFCASL